MSFLFIKIGVGWLVVMLLVGLVIVRERNMHPKALFLLFTTELWERFSYYGMRSLLILYMTSYLKFEDQVAYGIYGAYGALVYATPVLGGLIAEKLLGYRNAIFIGAVVMAIGHGVMAIDSNYAFYLALGLLIVGNGMFKPNISSLVGKLYDQDPDKKDRAFTIFYMGINAGAFLAPITCGAIGQEISWHLGFGIAGVGMVIGLLIFLYGQKKGYFQEQGMPVHATGVWSTPWAFLGITILASPLLAMLVKSHEHASVGLSIVGGAVILGMFVYSFFVEKVEMQRMWVILVLFVFTTLFWSFFEQAGSSLTLFTERNVDRTIMGNTIQSAEFQSVNPFFIMLLVPLFTWLWTFLDKRKTEPSSPLKFALGILQLGLGFWLLVLGAQQADGNGMVPLFYLVAGYLLHTTGELCLSPIGLSLVTKLSPKSIVAFVMGIWFLSSSFAHLVGTYISKLTARSSSGIDTSKLSSLDSLPVYNSVFSTIAWISIGVGLFLLLLLPMLRKWMNGVR